MTVFTLLAAAMLVAAAAVVVVPLFRPSRSSEESPEPPARGSAIVAGLFILMSSSALYAVLGSPQLADRDNVAAAEQAEVQSIEAMVEGLSARLTRDGGSAEEWVTLGRSRFTMEQYDSAAAAYRQAYRLTSGQSPDILTAYAEALVMADRSALAADAGDLIDRALKIAPNDPKALWYGGLSAFERADFATAKRRWETLLAINPDPPANVRQVLEQQIAVANERLGLAPEAALPAAAAPAPAPQAEGVEVNVTLSPALAEQVDPGAALFIIARAPGQGGGPPLAVVRRRAGELPLTEYLSDNNAMVAGLTISTQAEVEIVARVALSGGPIAQSGDLFGLVAHSTAGSGVANIEINQVQP